MRIISFFICSFLLIVFTMCSNTQTLKPPNRHSSIPKEAVWQGGADGGAWFIVNQGSRINTFKVKVFNENDGSVWADGVFMVSDNCSDTVFNVEGVRQLISYYDGEIIGLTIIRKKKYCSLIPLKK